MPKLRLSEMQDIGGCRAIVRDIHCVNKLVKAYSDSDMRHRLEYKDDYIKKPKIRTGYRGIPRKSAIVSQNSERSLLEVLS